MLSGGGPKGAFQTGAAYHLVVDRGCDFHQFSGVSVGALNAAFLAQAPEAVNTADSHARLVEQSEALVSLWDSIKGPRDVLKGRRLATLRFGLFGLESLNDFKPLRKLLEANISLDKLAHGRPVRVGVVNFWGGGYREIAARPLNPSNPNFMDFLYASSVPPVLGKMQRIREPESGEDPGPEIQFGDGSVRHITPVASYFPVCSPPRLLASLGPPPGGGVAAGNGSACDRSPQVHDQQALEQLFVIVTSPYSRASDALPVSDPKSFRPGSRQITKGPKVLTRTLELMVDANYRQDLDFLQFANDMLRWRRQAYDGLLNGRATEPVTERVTERVQEVKQQFNGASAFPFESFNRDPEDLGAPSRPYQIGLVIPQKEYAATGSLLVFSPPMIREQLYCGCVAADLVMQTEFGLTSLEDRCAQRFPPLPKGKAASGPDVPLEWQPGVCQKIAQ